MTKPECFALISAERTLPPFHSKLTSNPPRAQSPDTEPLSHSLGQAGNSSMMPVVSDKVNMMKEIEKLDFNVEYQPDIYWEDFDKTIAFICQMVGITTNLAQGKKERLIVSEVESNDEFTTICEDTRLSFRKMGAEDAKETFGLSLSCENKVPDVKATQPMDNQEQQDEPTEE